MVKGNKMAEFLTKDSYDYRMREQNARREHYKNQAEYAKKQGKKAEYEAANKMANDAEQEMENIQQRVYKTNSKAQYQHEREQGDPNALQMSYEEWKKL